MKTLEAKSLVLLHHHLKALRLPTVGAECEKVARQAAADNVDHLTYLLQLLRAGAARPGEAGGRAAPEGGAVPDHEDARELRLQRPALGQQDAGGRAGPMRVHRQARERAAGRQPRHREVPPGHGPGRRGLRPGLQGALLSGHRARHHPDRGQRRAQLPAPQGPAGQARPARARRAGLRARLPRSAPSCSSTSSRPPTSAPA